ncbi:hypothetical protein ACC755_37315, partial [Rhizobium ruizarguesonis]
EKVRRAEAATKEALNKLAYAYDALRVQSRTDGLTGILTRIAFMEDLDATSQSGISGACHLPAQQWNNDERKSQ